MQYESKLIPILREGIEVTKMIFFKKLKEHLPAKYPHRETVYINRLAGALINEIFGTPNRTEPFASFAEENRVFINLELRKIGTELPEMCILLTDALRIQFLCDHQEGYDSSSLLTQAQELGILRTDRDVPLPAQFISLVRKLGANLELLTRKT